MGGKGHETKGIRFSTIDKCTIYSCSIGGDKKVTPVAINEKTDICTICNMQVVDNQFATQIILENGKSLVFDDIGCMHKWVDENANQKIDAQFVRDYKTQEWVSQPEATYVYNPDCYHSNGL